MKVSDTIKSRTLTADAKTYIADQVDAFFQTPEIRLYDSAGALIKSLPASKYRYNNTVQLKASDSTNDAYTVYSVDIYDSTRAVVWSTFTLATPTEKKPNEILTAIYEFTIT